MRRTIPIFVALALAAAPSAAQTAPECTQQRTALVLAGGGARGFAHVGVLRTLDSLRIRPDFIVGTSMGAIMGGMYASGYSGREIDSLLRTLPIGDLIHAYSPHTPGMLGEIPALAVWENAGRGYHLQTSAVREGEANAIVNALMLRGNLLARGDFDRLPIPLHVVTTDITTRAPVVLRSGDLARAVRASAAIPLIFPPVEIDGRLLFDGGVAANTPVGIARDLGADRIILSAVPAVSADPTQLDDPFEVAYAMALLLFVDDTTALRDGDIRILTRTDGYNTLEFSPVQRDALIRAGGLAARAALDGACVRPIGRHAEPPPRLQVNAVRIRSENGIDRATLRTALRLRGGAPIAEDSLRRRLLALGHTDGFRAVWLSPTGEDSLVDFEITPVERGGRFVSLGLAYDNDHGGRIWASTSNRRLWGGSTEGAAMLDVSKYRVAVQGILVQQIGVSGRAVPLYASAGGADEDVRVVIDHVEYPATASRSLELRLGARPALGAWWTADLSVVARAWNDHAPNSHGDGVGVKFGLRRGGANASTAIALEATALTSYRRATVEGTWRKEFGQLVFAPRVRAGWGRHLPVAEQFPFGGPEGFAGFIGGERRGSSEAVAALGVERRIFGPVRAWAEGMAGGVGGAKRFLLRGEAEPPYFGQLVAGARIGVSVQAPAIEIRVAQGYNDQKRRETFVRIGRWF